ncbi:MAG: iron ABC transporter permease [Pseudomonadota bacterium]
MAEQAIPEAGHRRADRRPLILGAFAIAAVLLLAAELAFGPVSLSLSDLLSAMVGEAEPVAQTIFAEIRAPRAALAVGVGAALALSGATLQGILRNPLADPGLIGVSAGAAVGAVTVIVLGVALFGEAAGPTGALRPYILPAGAFIGGAIVTMFVFLVAAGRDGVSAATLILAGVAVNAIAGAFIGAMVYISDDQQLRELTFWTMGSVGGARWTIVIPTLILALAACAALLSATRALDLFQLGERAAFHSGLDVESHKLRAGLLSALAVGAVTAAAGPIGFIGLVAPHIARLLIGPTHAFILPGAALIGAALTLAADLTVRLAAPPAEPPIGLATALIGGPFFLWLVIRHKSHA